MTLEVSDSSVDLQLKPDDAVHLSTPGAAWLNVLPESCDESDVHHSVHHLLA